MLLVVCIEESFHLSEQVPVGSTGVTKKGDSFVALQPEVGFVNQSGDIKGWSLRLRADLEVSHALELIVRDPNQLLGRAAIGGVVCQNLQAFLYG